MTKLTRRNLVAGAARRGSDRRAVGRARADASAGAW